MTSERSRPSSRMRPPCRGGAGARHSRPRSTIGTPHHREKGNCRASTIGWPYTRWRQLPALRNKNETSCECTIKSQKGTVQRPKQTKWALHRRGVEAHEEVDHRRLAAAALADEGHGRAWEGAIQAALSTPATPHYTRLALKIYVFFRSDAGHGRAWPGCGAVTVTKAVSNASKHSVYVPRCAPLTAMPMVVRTR